MKASDVTDRGKTSLLQIMKQMGALMGDRSKKLRSQTGGEGTGCGGTGCLPLHVFDLE